MTHTTSACMHCVYAACCSAASVQEVVGWGPSLLLLFLLFFTSSFIQRELFHSISVLLPICLHCLLLSEVPGLLFGFNSGGSRSLTGGGYYKKRFCRDRHHGRRRNGWRRSNGETRYGQPPRTGWHHSRGRLYPLWISIGSSVD